MEVSSLREPKMSGRVADVLRKMFIRGEIPEGTKLPPEAELMAQFGVSRPTLREAFRILESQSLIEMERGVRGGARVTRPARETLAGYAGLILQYDGVTLRDVYDARAVLETPIVAQLAKDRDPAVIAELEAIVAREGSKLTGEEGFTNQTGFHAAIARLSGNQTLQMLSEMLHHIIEKANRSMQPTEGARADRALRRSAKTHAMVLELIKAGNADEAAQLWHRHLVKAEEYVLAGSESSTVVDLLD
ncbi:FadR/GntR family transcriptional regulator [Mycolicibacterium sphagni]|uniref:FadR/GntR family transcriptional regulator n=1 Tax=Mycolicibacterium sphagni TaxID=1786 RepID=UPI0021F26B02|nr:FCD domain-containing protein [Mycolicibacterium sphagni]MCV7177814.1 FadR family transcriptional regulator [Mycolicibacterium sphagni]